MWFGWHIVETIEGNVICVHFYAFPLLGLEPTERSHPILCLIFSFDRFSGVSKSILCFFLHSSIHRSGVVPLSRVVVSVQVFILQQLVVVGTMSRDGECKVNARPRQEPLCVVTLIYPPFFVWLRIWVSVLPVCRETESSGTPVTERVSLPVVPFEPLGPLPRPWRSKLGHWWCVLTLLFFVSERFASYWGQN